MTDYAFISDTHFSHENILKFKRKDGTLVRDFQDIEAMDHRMIHNWNSVATPRTHMYHLGDYGFGRRDRLVWIYHQLLGQKRLTWGNHDPTWLGTLFQKASLWRIFKEFNIIASHIPLREDQMRHCHFNLHGHIHTEPSPSERHICVCVEQVNYTPVSLDWVLEQVKQRSS